MILITGDTHGLWDFAKLEKLAQEASYTKDDYLIIAGDCGILWNEETKTEYIEKYLALPFTILFIDGNHENFDMLDAYPITTWCGGLVHQIAPTIYHLMRGQVFIINNKKFFTFGGAESIDKARRIENISWWEREIPSLEEFEEAKKNLALHNNQVDYIITHSIDELALFSETFIKKYFKPYYTNKLLSYFEETITYKHWFFGHYHLDVAINDHKTALYDDIIKLCD